MNEELTKNLKMPESYILSNLTKKTSEEDSATCKKDYVILREQIDNSNTNAFLDLDSQEFKNFKKEYINKIKNIINQKIDGSIVKCSSEVFIVLGLPAAGKSSTIRTIRYKNRAFHVDYDKIKVDVATEFNLNVNSDIVSDASRKINNEILNYVQHKKINYIQEKVGNNFESIENMVERLVSRGYSVSLDLIQISNETSRRRNMARCQGFLDNNKLPRIIPDNVIKDYSDTPLETYLMLTQKHPEWFKHCACYTTEMDKEKGIVKEPFNIKGLEFENGKQVVGKKYYDEANAIKEYGRKITTDLILESIKDQDEKMYQSLSNWNDVYSNQNVKLPESKSDKETKIRTLVENLTEELMLDVFKIYDNECIIDDVKGDKFNFDTEKLKTRINRIIQEKYKTKILSEKMVEIEEEYRKELKMKEKEQKRQLIKKDNNNEKLSIVNSEKE